MDFISYLWLSLAEVSLPKLPLWFFFVFSPFFRNEDSRFSFRFTFVFLISPRCGSISLRPAFEQEWGRAGGQGGLG